VLLIDHNPTLHDLALELAHASQCLDRRIPDFYESNPEAVSISLNRGQASMRFKSSISSDNVRSAVTRPVIFRTAWRTVVAPLHRKNRWANSSPLNWRHEHQPASSHRPSDQIETYTAHSTWLKGLHKRKSGCCPLIAQPPKH
jgi:hypothetical protein